MIQARRGSHPPGAGPVPPRARPSSGVSPGLPHFWELPCLTAALCPLWVLPAPEELDAWALGLESLAGPTGAAKGIQGLCAGFVGKGPRGSHSKDEGGGRVSQGGGGGTWNLLEAPALGDGLVSWDSPPRWSSGCRGVLTCTQACFIDTERRPGP